MRGRFLSAVSGLAIAALAASVTAVSPAADAVVRTTAAVSCSDQKAAAQQAVGSAQSGVESAKAGLDAATGKVKKAKKKRKAAKSATARKKATARLKKAKQAKGVASQALTDADGKLAGAQRALAALGSCKDVTPDPDPQPDPLTFDFADSVGLGLLSPSTPARAARGQVRTAAGASGSNLVAVLPDGSTRDAVSSGEVSVDSFSITGNGDVLISFADPYPVLEWDLLPGGSGPTACAVAVVDRESGEPTCLGSSSPGQGWFPHGRPLNARDVIQYDASGAGWFVLNQGEGAGVASYQDGTVTLRYANDNIDLRWAGIGGLVPLGDGSVLAAGTTRSNQQMWCRRVTPAGGLERVLDGVSSCGVRLPDGNVYLNSGLGDNTGTQRYLAGELRLEERKWTDSEGDPYFLFEQPSEPVVSGWVPSVASGWLRRALLTSSGEVFFLQGIVGSRLARLYPTPEYVAWASLTPISQRFGREDSSTWYLEGAGTKLIAGGFDYQGKLHATAYDTTTDSELWHVTGIEEKLEIDEAYHIQPQGDSVVLVDGLRFSDNKVVLGRVDLVSGEAEVLSVVGASKWSQFQTFN